MRGTRRVSQSVSQCDVYTILSVAEPRSCSLDQRMIRKPVQRFFGKIVRKTTGARSVEILLREGGKAQRSAQGDLGRLGRCRNDSDGPARRHARGVLQHRADMAGDGRAAGADGGGPAVELCDAETPDFLLVRGFERVHEKLSCAF